MPAADRSLPSRALTRDDLPDPRADFDDIVRFAYTYDGYAVHGMQACAELANATLDRFIATRELPTGVDTLRACLFFEARRWIVLEAEPDTRARLYVGALLTALAEALDRQHREASALPLL